jgi:hypothetical protein
MADTNVIMLSGIVMKSGIGNGDLKFSGFKYVTLPEIRFKK